MCFEYIYVCKSYLLFMNITLKCSKCAVDPDSDAYKELAKLKQLAKDYENLALSIRDSLLLGQVVSDAQCVALIIHEIRQVI